MTALTVWLLLEITESGVVLETTAVVFSVPVSAVRYETVACTEAPAGTVPSAHDTPIGPVVQDTWGVEVSRPVAPSGTCSLTTTPAAASGPPLVTVIW